MNLRALSFCFLWLGLLLTGAGAAELKAEITGFGILQKPGVTISQVAPETASGRAYVSMEEWPVLQSTTTIPAKVGTFFGYSFRLTGLPLKVGEMNLIRVTTYPPLTNPQGGVSRGSERILPISVLNGTAESGVGYSFDEPWELVPGTWTFEVKFNGQSLCKKEFTVVAAE